MSLERGKRRAGPLLPSLDKLIILPPPFRNCPSGLRRRRVLTPSPRPSWCVVSARSDREHRLHRVLDRQGRRSVRGSRGLNGRDVLAVYVLDVLGRRVAWRRLVGLCLLGRLSGAWDLGGWLRVLRRRLWCRSRAWRLGWRLRVWLSRVW